MSAFRPIHAFGSAVRRYRKRRAPGGVILMYHHVARVGSDPWRLSVTPENFAQQLDVLRQHTRPIGLQQLVGALTIGELLDRSSVVTFDDGYADNLHFAKPILERFDVPATAFIVTGHTGNNREFWWDELDQLLMQQRLLPPRLELTLEKSVHKWELGSGAELREDDGREVSQATPGSRLAFYHDVWCVLQPLSAEIRRVTLDQIRTWAGVTPVTRPSHRPMNEDEIVELAAGSLVEIGAHGSTHSPLPTMQLEAQRQEMQQSKTDLEDLLGRHVTAFSYPHGAWTPATGALARESGFLCATADQEDTVWPRDDTFRLPRFRVENWDAVEFEKKLLGWFQMDNSI